MINTLLKLLTGICMLIFVGKPTLAQHTHPPMPTQLGDEISAERIMTQIRDLASPGFQGREMGSPGNHQAADWISLAFNNRGLSTLPNQEDFQIPFDIQSLSLSEDSYFTIDGDSLSLFDEFTSTHYGASGTFRGEPVSVKWTNHQDHSKEDISGRILVISVDEEESLHNGEYGIHPAAHWADSLSAEAVIFTPDSYTAYLQHAYRFESDISIPQETAKHIGNTVQPFVKQKQLDIPVLVTSFDSEDFTELSISAHIELNVARTARANNVVSYLGDFQPDSPFILVSAHFDGQGLHPDTGVPIFGANRNATGISVLLEIANALEGVEDRLEYPVVFAAWNGHERFRAGLEHFFESVWTDHDNLMSYINLSELSGQRDTTQVKIYGQDESSELHPHIDEIARKNDLAYSYHLVDFNESPILRVPESLSTEKLGINGGPYTYTGRIHDSPDKINMRQVYNISLFSLELIWNLSTLYEPL